jgi:hypothetical protein
VAVDLYIHVIAVISIIVNMALIIRLLTNREQMKDLITYLSIGSNFFLLIWIVLTYVNIAFVRDLTDDQVRNMMIFASLRQLDSFIGMIANLAVIFSLFLLSLFVNQLIKPTPSNKRIAFFMAGLAAIFTTRLVFFVTSSLSSEDIFNLNLIQSIFNLIILIGFLHLANRDFRILLKEELSNNQKRQINGLRFANIIGVGSMIPIIVWVTFTTVENIVFGFFAVSIALFLIFRAYLNEPRVAFILPDKAYMAMVVNSHGALKYSRKFKEGDSKLIDEMLVSAALTGITSLMSEFYRSDGLQTNVQPKFINFEEDMIQFKFSAHFFIAVFCSTESKLLQQAVDRVESEILLQYGEDLERLMLIDTNTLEIDRIFDNAFYFIYYS